MFMAALKERNMAVSFEMVTGAVWVSVDGEMSVRMKGLVIRSILL